MPDLSVSVAEAIGVADSPRTLARHKYAQMRQVLGGVAGGGSSSTSNTIPLVGGLSTWASSYFQRSTIITEPGTIRYLKVRLPTTAAFFTSGAITYTLLKNGSATAMAVQLKLLGTVTGGSGVLEATDTTHSVDVVDGDTIAVQVTNSASNSPNLKVNITAEFTAQNAGAAIHGGPVSTAVGTGTLYNGLLRLNDVFDSSSTLYYNVISAPGDISRLIIELETAPGAGTSRSFQVYVNDTPQPGIITFSNSEVGPKALDLAIHCNGGDKVQLVSTTSGAAASTRIRTGVRYVADTDGEVNVCNCQGSSPSNTTTNFNAPATINLSSTWISTETRYTTSNPVGPTRYRVKNFYVWMNGLPGAGKTYTFDWRKNGGSAGAFTIQVTNSSTFPLSDTSNSFDVANSDDWGIRCVPAGTPTFGRVLTWAATAYIDPMMPVLDLLATEIVSFTESTTRQINALTLSRSVNEAKTVTESVTAQLATVRLTPSPSEVISVADVPTANLVDKFNRNVNDAISVADVAAFDTSVINVPPRAEAISVADVPTVAARTFSYPVKQARDYIIVKDVVTAKLLVSGGIGVRVFEAIQVQESRFVPGFPAIPGSPGLPDTGTVTIGEEPGVTTSSLGDDYWVAGA